MGEFRLNAALRTLEQTLPLLSLRAAFQFGWWLALLAAMEAGSFLGAMSGEDVVSAASRGWFGGALACLAWLAARLAVRRHELFAFIYPHLRAMADAADGVQRDTAERMVEDARKRVEEEFGNRERLWRIDRLLSDCVGVIVKDLGGLSAYLQFPGFQGLAALGSHLVGIAARSARRMLVIHALAVHPENAIESLRQSVVLYAGDDRRLVLMSLKLWSGGWLATVLTYLALAGPVSGLLFVLPGNAADFSTLAALSLALAVKAAFFDPLIEALSGDMFNRHAAGLVPQSAQILRLMQLSPAFSRLGDLAWEDAGRV